VQKYVIIAAGGIGMRMKSHIPKQYLAVNDVPIIIHTINKFQFAIPGIRIIVVLSADKINSWEQFCLENDFKFNHEICVGGETRFHSIKKGLGLIQEHALVAIHDAVRPLVTVALIQDIFKHAEANGNAVPAVKMDQAVRVIENGINKSVDRSNYRIIQTPQCFHSDILRKAYQQNYEESFTDDATVVERTGTNINLIEGDINNIKITTQQDMLIAETLIASGF
jgi:2-C-methyl-D-erythritol 4-phosphate cytidylyltransferase